MLKIALVTLHLLAFASCAARQAERHGASQPAPATTESNVSTEGDGDQLVGQTIYVPVYSHIYTQDKSRVINLSATLSVRNTDAQNPIRVASVRYYGTNGELVKDYLNEAVRLAPMASTDYVVEADDTSGGAGANFIVEWSAGVEVTEPVVEAIMISTAQQQGISFVSAGRVIKDRTPRTSGR